MKKKLTQRVLSFVLAIVLMMSMAITASAATVTWTEGSYTYQAIVTEGATVYKYRDMPNGEQKHHTKNGGRTSLYLASSYFSISAPTGEFNSTYKSYLVQALNATTNLESSRGYSTTGLYVYAESDYPTGLYGVTAQVVCKKAPWMIQRNSTDTVDGGTLSYAPTMTCNYLAMLVD